MDMYAVIYIIAAFCLVFAVVSAYLIYQHVQDEKRQYYKNRLRKEKSQGGPSKYAEAQANGDAKLKPKMAPMVAPVPEEEEPLQQAPHEETPAEPYDYTPAPVPVLPAPMPVAAAPVSANPGPATVAASTPTVAAPTVPIVPVAAAAVAAVTGAIVAASNRKPTPDIPPPPSVQLQVTSEEQDPPTTKKEKKKKSKKDKAEPASDFDDYRNGSPKALPPPTTSTPAPAQYKYPIDQSDPEVPSRESRRLPVSSQKDGLDF